MRKTIIAAGVLVVAALGLRRFGPSLRAWCEARCRQVMAKRRGDAGTDESRSFVPTGNVARTVT